ncbi:DUF4271 domain-containing protein [Shivajiella indica]|uniref:DUF4271 domain-containing protein n=1 Tax=Shivajiella indica TaxID=872115 RepID=A0ABW5B4Z0_9BACT
MKKRGLFLIFFLFLVATAQSQIIENYQSKLRIEREVGIFSKKERAIIGIDVINFPQSSFRFEIPSGSTAFLGDKLWFFTDKDTTFQIDLLELNRQFEFDGAAEIDLTILNEKLDPGEISVFKGLFEVGSGQLFESKTLGLDFSKREISDFNDFFTIALVIILFLFAVFKLVFPIVLGFIAKPQTVFTAEDFSETGSLQKFFSADVLFYLLLINLGIGLICMLVWKVSGNPNYADFVNKDINGLIFYWFLTSFFLVILSIVKFLSLKVMVSIFDLKKFEFAHFFYLLRIISISLFLVLGFSTYFFFNDQTYLPKVLQISITGFFWVYLFGVFYMYVIGVNRTIFKNYHLFAYICTAELIPFLILSKMVIG